MTAAESTSRREEGTPSSTSDQTASEMRRRHALIVLPQKVSVENLSLSLEFVNTAQSVTEQVFHRHHH